MSALGSFCQELLSKGERQLFSNQNRVPLVFNSWRNSRSLERFIGGQTQQELRTDLDTIPSVVGFINVNQEHV